MSVRGVVPMAEKMVPPNEYVVTEIKKVVAGIDACKPQLNGAGKVPSCPLGKRNAGSPLPLPVGQLEPTLG